MKFILMVLVGCIYIDSALLIAQPETVRRTIEGLLESTASVFMWAGVALVIGGLLFWSAPAAQWPLFFQIFGVLAVAKGLFLGVLFPKWGIGLLRWWAGVPRWLYRVWGAFAFALATAGFYAL